MDECISYAANSIGLNERPSYKVIKGDQFDWIKKTQVKLLLFYCVTHYRKAFIFYPSLCHFLSFSTFSFKLECHVLEYALFQILVLGCTLEPVAQGSCSQQGQAEIVDS